MLFPKNDLFFVGIEPGSSPSERGCSSSELSGPGPRRYFFQNIYSCNIGNLVLLACGTKNNLFFVQKNRYFTVKINNIDLLSFIGRKKNRFFFQINPLNTLSPYDAFNRKEMFISKKISHWNRFLIEISSKQQLQQGQIPTRKK